MRRTVEVVRGGPRPTIRLRRVPPCEPPYDDEREQPFWPIANQLALDWSPPAPTRAGPPPPATSAPGRRPTSRPPTPEARFTTSPVAAAEASADAKAATPAGRTPEAAEALVDAGAASPAGRTPVAAEASVDVKGAWPAEALVDVKGAWPGRARPVVAGTSAEAKAAVHRFVRLCVEVLNGYRPAAHLRRYSLPGEAAGVVAQGLAAAHRVTSLRKAAQAPGRRPPRRPSPAAVVRLRLCEPRPGAVEAAVALVTGERTWALALRLELHQDIWSATALRLI